ATVAQAADAFSALLDALALAASPLRSLEFLAKRLPAALPVPPAARLPLLRALALSTPAALLARDGRCGPSSLAAPAILRALLAKNPDSTPKFLLERFNSAVLPSSQIGAGRLRALLLADPAIRRVSPSHYALLPAP
ncbi:MAG: hypothetical protein IK066_13035, partial [Kiritimatiellae bacterium]|nr:hypothetical protein [Kiritimatiellia bacterium]